MIKNVGDTLVQNRVMYYITKYFGLTELDLKLVVVRSIGAILDISTDVRSPQLWGKVHEFLVTTHEFDPALLVLVNTMQLLQDRRLWKTV